jgi:hypothetical protein
MIPDKKVEKKSNFHREIDLNFSPKNIQKYSNDDNMNLKDKEKQLKINTPEKKQNMNEINIDDIMGADNEVGKKEEEEQQSQSQSFFTNGSDTEDKNFEIEIFDEYYDSDDLESVNTFSEDDDQSYQTQIYKYSNVSLEEQEALYLEERKSERKRSVSAQYAMNSNLQEEEGGMMEFLDDSEIEIEPKRSLGYYE